MTRRRRIILLSAVICAGLLALFAVLDSRMRPVIKRIAEARATGYCNLVISQAVTDCMAAMDTDYSDLMHLRQSGDGSAGVLTADIAAINLLKARLIAAVQEKMNVYTESSIGIRLGTLFGSDFLTDRGPMIELKIIPVSNVSAAISNQFLSGGINQTLHRIMMQMVVDISIVLPGYSTTTTVVNEFCISETIIIGNVPDSYFEDVPSVL